MNDLLLVRVLHGIEYLQKELNSRSNAKSLSVAPRGQRMSSDIFHRQVRPPAVRHSGIVEPGNIRML